MNGNDIVRAFANGTVTKVAKPWGLEVVWCSEGIEPPVRIKLITVLKGRRTSMQHHNDGEEAVVIVSGPGTVDGVEPPLSVGSHTRPSRPFHIDTGDIHRSIGAMTLLEVTAAGPDDIVRHTDDFGREGTTGA